jgi:hypothetical protein
MDVSIDKADAGGHLSHGTKCPYTSGRALQTTLPGSGLVTVASTFVPEAFNAAIAGRGRTDDVR